MYSNDAYKWGCKPNEQEAKMTEKMDCARDFDNQMGHDEDYPSTQEEKDEIKEIIEFWEINQILSFDQVESLFSHIQSLESELKEFNTEIHSKPPEERQCCVGCPLPRVIKELESQLNDGKVAIDILAKLNVMLVLKHGKIFNIDGKAPSWDWTIEKLDEILTQLNVKGL
jgi:predicted RNase H-like nuclease (RuvC/YqgF family)